MGCGTVNSASDTVPIRPLEAAVSSTGPIAEREGRAAPPPIGRAQRIGLDWWSVIVAGVVVALAVAGLLPKIPW